MRLVETKEVFVQWSDLENQYENVSNHLNKYLSSRSSNGRTPGLHVSDVIKYQWYGKVKDEIERERKKIEVIEDLGGDPSVMPLRMFLGMAWEIFCVGLYPAMKWQPKSVCLDEIHGSPDGVSGSQRYMKIVDEFKLTWKSNKGRDILKETVWIWQVAAYCMMLGARYARLHVCWANGNYTYNDAAGGGPRYIRYLIEFEQFELERLWKHVYLRNKKATELWKQVA